MSGIHLGTCPTREVTFRHVEGVHHSHADQDGLQVIRLLQLEPRQPDLHLHLVHHVWSRPLYEVLTGQLLLQLRRGDLVEDLLVCLCLLGLCVQVSVRMCVLPSPDRLCRPPSHWVKR